MVNKKHESSEGLSDSADKRKDTTVYGDVVLEYVDDDVSNKEARVGAGKSAATILMYIMLGVLLVILVPLVIGFYRGFFDVESSIIDFNVLTELLDRAISKFVS